MEKSVENMFQPKVLGQNEKIRMYKTWWLLFAAGCAFACLGITSLLQPWITFLNLAKYSGFAVLASGTLTFIHVFIVPSTRKEATWLVFESVLDFFLATILLFNPFLAVIAFPFLIGGWMFIRGLIKIFASITLSHMFKQWTYIFSIGILSSFFGLVIIFYPFPKFTGIRLCMSIFAIVMGAVYIFDSWRLKNREDALIAII